MAFCMHKTLTRMHTYKHTQTRLWFDEFEEAQRGHLLDRMQMVCTTPPPPQPEPLPQDDLADLLGNLKVCACVHVYACLCVCVCVRACVRVCA